MEILIKAKDYLTNTGIIFWDGLSNDYWPQYHGWLTRRLAEYNLFMVLTLATFFVFFFFLVYYWSKNR